MMAPLDCSIDLNKVEPCQTQNGKKLISIYDTANERLVGSLDGIWKFNFEEVYLVVL